MMQRLKQYFNTKITAYLNRNADSNLNKMSAFVLTLLLIWGFIFFYVLNLKAVSKMTGDLMQEKAIWEIILGR